MIPKVYDRWLARQSVVSWIYVFVGSVVLSAGFVLFMNPYRIVPGGVYGTGIVLHYLFPSVQVGTFGLMLDIPLLLVGMKVFGRGVRGENDFSALLTPFREREDVAFRRESRNAVRRSHESVAGHVPAVYLRRAC